MSTVEDDIKLVRDLIAWADTNSNQIAKRIGVANTTINRFANGTAKTRLHRLTITKLQEAYPGFGGFPATVEPNAEPFQMEGASEARMRNDLPIYGTVLGAARQVDGEAIEQTTLNKAEVVEYAKRPVLLDGNASAYGVYVSGCSMEPRHNDGETVLVDPKGRLRSGEDVIVYLRPVNPEEDDGDTARAVLIKRLVRRTSTYVELEQFTPPKVFRIDMVEITHIHRVIPWSELLI